MSNLMKKTMVAGVCAAALSGLVSPAIASDTPAKEKCFGVAKAGKNDCGAKGLSCAGHSTEDNQSNAFIVLPKGTCERLTGGSLEPK